jgi:spermidine synthase
MIRLQIVTEWPVEDIVALYSSAGWWRESPAARAAIPRMIAGSFCFMVGTEGESTVAMGRAISDGASDAYIQDVAVLNEHRGRGVGKRIITALTQHCLNQGIVWIGLVAEPGTTSFYERLGYRTMPGFVPMRFPTSEQP